MNKSILFSVVACMLLTSLPSVTGAAASGKIVIARGVDVTSLDPQKAISSVDLNYCSTVFDGLLRRRGKDELSPNLAESYRTIDPTTWEFKIRQGVFFHNGDPLTAADVVFSFKRAKDSSNPFNTFFAGLREVVAIDPFTVRIVTAKPDPVVPKRMAFAAYIVPEKYIREKGDAYFAEHPVGTGRYRFVRREPGQFVELEANDRYWGSNPAKIKSLVLRSIPDPNMRMEALIKGDIHIAAGVPPHAVSDLRKQPGIDVVSGPSGRVIFVGFNLLKAEGGPVSDRRVRQAISHAIDRNALIRDGLLGAGEPLNTPLVTHAFGYDAFVEPHAFDLKRARDLLAEAGYPEGFDVVLATPSGRYIRDRQVASAIADMLGKVGIRVHVKVYEWAEYMQIFKNRRAESLYLLGWGNTIFDADGILVPLFSSKSSISYYSNAELDTLLEAARFEMDQEKRKALYLQSLLLIREDVPGIFLYEQIESYGVSRNVLNFSPLHGSERKDGDLLGLEEVDTLEDMLEMKDR